MGGKSSKIPAPPPELVAAQIESLGIQNDAVRRLVGLSEEMAPLQRQQLQQTIEQSKQLWHWNEQDRQFALQKREQLSGIQDAIARDATTFSEAGRREQLAGQSDADVAQAFGMQRQAMDRSMARMGVNPNDGRAMAGKGAMAISEALARVQGRKVAGDTARAERLQLYDRANNALAGYPSMTMGAQGQGVNTMGAGLSAFNAGIGGMMQTHQGVAGAAGQMGNNAASMYGVQMNAHLQDRANRAAGWQAFGSALGSIGGAFLGKKLGL